MNTQLMRVLLVGRGAKGSLSLLHHLEKRGCKCEVVTSSSEAARLFVDRAFDLVLCTDLVERFDSLIASLIGSRTTLFLCHPVEDGCWWLPAVRHGEKCLGAPALRLAEFGFALEGLAEEIESEKHLPRQVADCADQPCSTTPVRH
jgi:hypothetical protein